LSSVEDTLEDSFQLSEKNKMVARCEKRAIWEFRLLVCVGGT
jgi:hypothetical protein